ncbi:MAG TPA: hypothetical protein VGM51_00675 [Armatimonadota bacterium]|jgi:hypothetical protein
MEKALRYVASALGLGLTAMVAVIAVGEGAPNPFTQPLPVQLDFAALGIALAGTLIALKWEGIGGAMMVAGTLAFDGVEWVVNHRHFPFMLVFALVGVLHLLAASAQALRNRPRARNAG